MLESKMSRFIVITSGSYLKSKHLVPLLLPSSGFYACAKKLALELLGRCPLGSFAKDGKWIGVTFLQPKWFWGRCVRVLVKCSFWQPSKNVEKSIKTFTVSAVVEEFSQHTFMKSSSRGKSCIYWRSVTGCWHSRMLNNLLGHFWIQEASSEKLVVGQLCCFMNLSVNFCSCFADLVFLCALLLSCVSGESSCEVVLGSWRHRPTTLFFASQFGGVTYCCSLCNNLAQRFDFSVLKFFEIFYCCHSCFQKAALRFLYLNARIERIETKP